MLITSCKLFLFGLLMFNQLMRANYYS